MSASSSAVHSPHYATLTSQSSSSTTPSLTSLLHQKLTTTNVNQYDSSKTSNGVNQKQILLNDIASGLANAVAVAVSNAVSSVHQQMNNQDISRQQPIQPQQQHQFSHLRQQLESKEPNAYSDHQIQQQQHPGNAILRKRLSNINIEAAVATAVNRYLTATIKNNQKLTSQPMEQDDAVIAVDANARLINSV